jgi:phenylalanyl-tRNA synthetase beta chain
VASALTSLGLEVEDEEIIGRSPEQLQGLLVGKVVDCVPHPGADRLRLTRVDVGSDTLLNIVCGAPNVQTGLTVAVAPVGSTIYPLKGEPITIRQAKIRGELSQGMLCAEDELGLGPDHDGLLILNDTAEAGTPLIDVLSEPMDWIWTLGITPNRMDALSHYGVTRDLGAALGLPVLPLACLCRENSPLDREGQPIKAYRKAQARYKPMTLAVQNGQDCPRLAGLALEGVRVGPSPLWLQKALLSLGHKPINNVVDITNWVQFKLGQPLHAYDRSFLEGDRLGVRRANPGEKIRLLDQMDYTLNAQHLVIEDGVKAVGLAGVMGGAGDSIHPDTTDIYLECACFDPPVIRASARSLGIRSEASYRFERGTDPNLVPLALEWAAALILYSAGGEIPHTMQQLIGANLTTEAIPLSSRQIQKVAGCAVPEEETVRILKALDFEVEVQAESWLVTPPYYRRDVRRGVDIIEEVLRVYGYDRIPIPDQHRYRNPYPVPSAQPSTQEKIAQWLSARGFNEFVGLSLVSTAEFQAIEPDLTRGVRVLGPVNEQIPLMRPSLLLSGLKHLAYNLNRRQNDVQCYEFGRVYALRGEGQAATEEEHLAILVTGQQHPETWYRPSTPVDAAYLQGHVQDLWAYMGSPEGSDLPKVQPVADHLLELFGIRQPVFACLIPWTAWVPQQGAPSPVYREIPRFPSVRRDLALVVPSHVSYKALEELARQNGGPFLESIHLFDRYQGQGLPPNHVSYAIALIFRNSEQTLTDQEVEGTIQKMVVNFEESLGARLRR